MPTKALTDENPAVQKIANLLANAFNSVEAKVMGDLRDQYRAYAKNRHEGFLAAARSPEKTGRIADYSKAVPAFRDWTDYTHFDQKAALADWTARHGDEPDRAAYKSYPPQSGFMTLEEVRPWLKYMKLDFAHVDRKAKDDFEHARDSFIYKNIGKVRTVLGQRDSIEGAEVKFGFRRNVFEGSMEVRLKDGFFFAHIGLKYVVRTIPRLTPYFQYPLVFTTARIHGKTVKRPSEEELRILLGGGAKPSREEELSAKGLCIGSGRDVPSEDWSRVANRYTPYLPCPVCKAAVSVHGARYRQHKSPSDQRAAAERKLSEAGYCPKSRQKVSPEVVAAMGPVEPYKDPKVICEGCGQLARLDARKDWIFPTDGSRATEMKVVSAVYYKHRIS